MLLNSNYYVILFKWSFYNTFAPNQYIFTPRGREKFIFKEKNWIYSVINLFFHRFNLIALSLFCIICTASIATEFPNFLQSDWEMPENKLIQRVELIKVVVKIWINIYLFGIKTWYKSEHNSFVSFSSRRTQLWTKFWSSVKQVILKVKLMQKT